MKKVSENNNGIIKKFCLILIMVILILFSCLKLVEAKNSVEGAIQWAENQGVGDNWDEQCGHPWAYYCQAFVGHCYLEVPSGDISAIAAWNRNDDKYGERHEGDYNAPRGALVFFNLSGDGHVGISCGDGTMWHAWIDGVRHGNISSYSNYLGWRWPNSWTDGGPLNEIFVRCYNRNGGESYFGQPYDNGGGTGIHPWSSGLIQDYRTPGGTTSAITQKPGCPEAYSVYGDIWQKYLIAGGCDGSLGWPVSSGYDHDQVDSWAGNPLAMHGYLTRFEIGTIYEHLNCPYWNQGDGGLGCFVVYGDIRKKFDNMGGSESPLGFPIQEQQEATISDIAAGNGWCTWGCFTRFEGGGEIYEHLNGPYWNQGTGGWGCFAIYGAIRNKYENISGSGGFLGFPITDITRSGDPSAVSGKYGYYCTFEGGGINLRDGDAQAYELHGKIWDKWAELHYVKSDLGYPLSDIYTWNSNYSRADFEGGSILSSGSTVWVGYKNRVGKESNGTTHQNFIDRFNANGGYASAGLPFNNGGLEWVHGWNGGWIQDFNWGNNGRGIICNHPSHPEWGTMYLYGNVLMDKFDNAGGVSVLGWPIRSLSQATNSPQGTEGQFVEFEHGSLHKSNYGCFALSGLINTAYLALQPSGTGSDLGFPTSDISNNRAEFEGGYILLDNGAAKVMYSTRPLISSVYPASGNNATTTVITITGRYFSDIRTVKIGNTVMAINSKTNSGTQAIVTVPSGLTVGAYDITVTTTSGGTSPTSASTKFTVTAQGSGDGDIDGDGGCDGSDANLCLQMALGLAISYPNNPNPHQPTPGELSIADLNHNGIADAGDAVLILQDAGLSMINFNTSPNFNFGLLFWGCLTFSVKQRKDSKKVVYKYNKALLFLILLVGIVLNGCGSGGGGGGGTASNSDPTPPPPGKPTISIPTGSGGTASSTVNVPVNISDADGIAGFDITVNFNGNILTAQNAIKSSQTNSFQIQSSSSTGSIRIVMANSTELGSGGITICNIPFRVANGASVGNSTLLTLASVKLYNQNGQEILISNYTIVNGDFTVR